MPLHPRFDLRALAADSQRFAHAFPGLATRLARPVSDPSTERLVEGNYFLAGTALDKIEDFQSSAYEVVAQRVCPWLRRPLPSSTVVAFDPPEGEARRVPALTRLEGKPVDGVACAFRTIQDLRLRCFRVARAALEVRAGRGPAVRITLESTSGAPIQTEIATGLSLFFGGDLEPALELVHAITTAIGRVEATSDDWPEPLRLGDASGEREGMGPGECIAPDPDGPAPAFGVITEALVVPDRFRLVRLRGLDACAAATPTSRITLSIVLREPLAAGEPRVLDVRTHCAAVTNLFDAVADPMPLDLERGPIPLRVAGARDATVYAVRDAWATAVGAPDYSFPLLDVRRLTAAPAGSGALAAFHAMLQCRQGAPHVAVAFSSLRADGIDGAERFVSVGLLATNGTRAAALRPGEFEGALTVAQSSTSFRSLVPCSPYVPPPVGNAFSRRTLRHAALARGRGHLLESLRDALFLAVPSWSLRAEDVRSMHLRIEAVRAVELTVARRRGASGAVQRGYGYQLTVDESAFRGPGELGLFGAALGQALAGTSPINTFAELRVSGLKGTFHSVYGADPS